MKERRDRRQADRQQIARDVAEVHIALRRRDVAEAKRQAARRGLPYTTYLRDELRRLLARERRVYKFRFPPSVGVGGVVVVLAESVDEARRLVVQFAHNYRGREPITGDWAVDAEAEEFGTDTSRVLAWAETAQ